MDERTNHVVIVGCGRVGSGLARQLAGAGHTVAIIDKRKEAFRRIPAEVEVLRLVGIGFDRRVLHEAGIHRASALAAVTNGDNSNIVIARVAHERFEVPRVVARIYDPRRAAIYERLGIPTVATVEQTIEHALNRILPALSGVAWIDPSARIVLLERELPPWMAGKALSTFEQPGLSRLVSLRRLGVALLPSAELIGQEGDMVHVAVSSDQIDAFEQRLLTGHEGQVHQ
jgi:trk system potassium uptake protein TrkA